MGDRIFVTEGETLGEPRIVFPDAVDRCAARLVEPVDEMNAPLPVLQRVANAFAIGGPKPLFLLSGTDLPVPHILARRNPDPCQKRVGLDQLADACPHVGDRRRIIHRVGNAIFAERAVGEDIPGEDIDLDSAVLRHRHDVAPEGDFLANRHLPDDLMIIEIFCFVLHRTVRIDNGRPERLHAAPDIAQRHVGIFGYFYH